MFSLFQETRGAAETESVRREDPPLLPLPEGGEGGAGRLGLPGQVPRVPGRHHDPLAPADHEGVREGVHLEERGRLREGEFGVFM